MAAMSIDGDPGAIRRALAARVARGSLDGTDADAVLARALAAVEAHRFAEAMEALETLDTAALDPLRRAFAALQHGVALVHTGEHLRATLHLLDALPDARADPVLLAQIQAERAVALKRLGMRTAALAANHAALDALLTAPPDPEGPLLLATVRNNLAILYIGQRDHDAALQQLQEALAVASRLDDEARVLRVQLQVNLARLLVADGRGAEARAHLEEAEEATRVGVPEPVRMRVLDGLADALRAEGELVEARRLAEEAVAFWAATDQRLLLAAARTTLGAVLADADDDDAEEVLEAAWSEASDVGNEDLPLRVATLTTAFLERRGRHAEACTWHHRIRALETARFDAGRNRTLTELRMARELDETRRQADEAHRRALEVARDTALRADRVKSTFLAVISHELRTPLNAIQGYTELLEEDLSDRADTHDLLGDVRSIAGASRALLRLIDRVLELTDLEAMTSAQPAQRVDVDALLAGIQVPGPVERDLFAGHQCVVAYHLEAAVRHLLENAVIHGTRASLEARSRDGVLEVTVTDDGPGLAEADLARLLEPFTQGDMSSTRRHGGLGLGLALTRHHLRLLTGTLEADSAPGALRITLRIPVADAC
jgi:signal transduction histidine kinase